MTATLPGRAPLATTGMVGARLGPRRASPEPGAAPAHDPAAATGAAAPAPAQDPLADPTPRADALRVVIVDDDRNFRHLLRFALTRHGSFSVVGEGANGLDAIRLAETHRPDLMLLDIKMPGMAGDKALPHVLRASPSTRVVVVSGLDALVMRHEMSALGAVGYVEKEGNILDIGRDLLALAERG